ncbi:serine/threonine-protein kinase [Actinopolymorpha sp. B17G11]|uniref:serine/threonine-protein kinase n=1 Tax=unclassified Actinopolymorpha TaxID=2627063 RepID=UPI0032D92437
MSRPLPPDYQPVQLLSRNHDYDVRLVHSAERDCLCVAKSVRGYRLRDQAVVDRLLTEGRLLQRFTHPHLVRAYDVREAPRPTVILEVLPGHTLSRLVIDRRAGLAVPDLARLGSQLCAALAYLHRHGTLHLDLKPSNLVVAAGLLKVFDLGLAQSPGPSPAGQGTPEYLAPEQARGADVSPATDVWGMGGVLYRAATRRRPFPDAGGDHFPQLHRKVDPIGRRLPRRLTDLVTACLDPLPGGRPSVAEVAAGLRALLPVDPARR